MGGWGWVDGERELGVDGVVFAALQGTLGRLGAWVGAGWGSGEVP